MAEEACSRLLCREVEELRSDTSRALWKNCLPPKSNISQEDFKDIKGLREDSSRIILTAHKRVAMVGMDSQDYLNKAQHLLDDKDT